MWTDVPSRRMRVGGVVLPGARHRRRTIGARRRAAGDHRSGGGAGPARSAIGYGPARSMWYFAYGSNMQSETLRGRRGVDVPARRRRAGAGLAGGLRQAAAVPDRRGVRQHRPRCRRGRARRGVRGERRRSGAHRAVGGRADRATTGASSWRWSRWRRAPTRPRWRRRSPPIDATPTLLPSTRYMALVIERRAASTACRPTTSRGSGRCPSAVVGRGARVPPAGRRLLRLRRS